MKPSPNLNWLDVGGPLILLPDRLLERWRGFDPSLEGELSDYDRACEVSDYVGAVTVGTEDALVLNDEPMPTAWIAQTDGLGGYFVRWEYASSEESIRNVIDQVAALEFSETDIVVTLDARNVLMSAVEIGNDPLFTRLLIVLVPGKYSVEWFRYKEQDVAIHFVRLKLKA